MRSATSWAARAWMGLAAALAVVGAGAAQARPADRPIIVDKGILRWADTRREVALFGVNYYAPFCMDFAALGTLGADRDATIRRDVAQFVRLGLDLVRLHTFDREISDGEGNLVDNEHLRLLDLLLAECKRNGIYAVLTPIAWWPAGRTTQGFSDRFTMPQMITDPVAQAAQRRYLDQFLRHRNRYTGLAYGADPMVAAIELINEPIPPSGTTDAQVTAYIDALTEAVRAAGCSKPVFFNGWGNRLAAVARSQADGCTFGWYPTGLVAGQELRADFLPRVADYPEMRSPDLGGKAVGVYEFDAADVAEPYMYPAMARAFRAGGAQFAAQFQYDATPLAPTNVNWQTHYLNLLCTPRKALSFMIAAEAFRGLPRLHTMRAHPANARFGEFRVSHAQGLSERVSATTFLYSNSTATRPPKPGLLTRIAGCGSSPVAAYEGSGAYFLDRVRPGLWRLEVTPDVVWVDDPFGATGLGREVARLLHRDRRLTLRLPDLGGDFQAMRSGNERWIACLGGSITVRPGVTFLRRRGVSTAIPAGLPAPLWLPEEARGLPARIRHAAPRVWPAGKEMHLRCSVAPASGVGSAQPVRVEWLHRGAWQGRSMRSTTAFEYACTIPAGELPSDRLEYRIRVGEGPGAPVFPGGRPAIGPEPAAVTLWEQKAGAAVPALELSGAPGQTATARVAASPDGPSLHLAATGFGDPPSCAAIQLRATAARPAPGASLVLRARALYPETTSVEVGLLQADGKAFGAEMPLTTEWSEVRLPLDALRPLWGAWQGRPDPAQVRQVRFTFGSWLYVTAGKRPHGLEVQRLRLEPEPQAWRVELLPSTDPLRLVAGDLVPAIQGGTRARAHTVGGSRSPALRVETPGFGPAPDAASFRIDLADALAPWRGSLARRPGLRIRARATEASTTAIEFVALEADGTPWGATVPLTTEWRDITLRWEELRFFPHWAHPAGRGGPQDRLLPERLASLNFCFGAWLYPKDFDQRHGFDIEGVWLDAP